MPPRLLTAADSPILLGLDEEIAIITFNTPKKKNALSLELYKLFAALLRKVDAMPDVVATVVTGGDCDFFSAGADVKATRDDLSLANKTEDEVRSASLARFAEGNLTLSRALYTHSKLLIGALNGPAIGLSAALLAHFDLLYATPTAYLLTPFSTLSLVCEGSSSATFPRRLGHSLAVEALVMGRKLEPRRLLQAGFLNEVVEVGAPAELVGLVVAKVREGLEGKDRDACLVSKRLIKEAMPDEDATNAREIFAAAERFATGKPQAQFAAIANKSIRHKL